MSANISKVGRSCTTLRHEIHFIAQELGIEVLFCNRSSQGMYRVIKRNVSFLSARIYVECSVLSAHELGHDQLHRNLAKGNALQEFMLYDRLLNLNTGNIVARNPS